jgi:hypothetical protein
MPLTRYIPPVADPILDPSAWQRQLFTSTDLLIKRLTTSFNIEARMVNDEPAISSAESGISMLFQ